MRGNFGNMMKQAQAMQANMQKVQTEIAALEVTGESGGGMVKVTMGTSTGSRWGRGMAFMAVLSGHFMRKEFDHTVDRVGRSLSESANGSVAHDLREVRERLLVPSLAGDQPVGLTRRADPLERRGVLAAVARRRRQAAARGP